MSTSLSYDFQNLDADLIIRDAFERCGIENWAEGGLKYDAARRSLNFLFSHWVNRGLSLFTVEQSVVEVVANQPVYNLPENTSKILEAKNANANRILGGIPSSSAGGNAAAPFTTTISGSCTQTSPDGNISYLYPSGTCITLVGIMSQTTQYYRLFIECSYLSSPTDDDWITVLETPMTLYRFGESNWFYLPFTKSAVNWRIRETSGNTLNIAQIYFGIPQYSVPMSSLGRDLYFQYPSNPSPGTSTCYWLNRIQTPTLNIYPYPDGSYQFIFYNRVRYIQDVGDFFNSVNVVGRFLEAVAAGLAAKLAEKYAPSLFPNLEQKAEKAYIEAAKEDTEYVNPRITFAPGAL